MFFPSRDGCGSASNSSGFPTLPTSLLPGASLSYGWRTAEARHAWGPRSVKRSVAPWFATGSSATSENHSDRCGFHYLVLTSTLWRGATQRQWISALFSENLKRPSGISAHPHAQARCAHRNPAVPEAAVAASSADLPVLSLLFRVFPRIYCTAWSCQGNLAYPYQALQMPSLSSGWV